MSNLYTEVVKPLIKKNYREGKKVEQDFASILSNVIWSSSKEDIKDHWDIQGLLLSRYGIEGNNKFDVKGIKKINSKDPNKQDELAWIESRNVQGSRGWLCGEADYIVFERSNSWMVVHRKELLLFINDKVKSLGYPKGKQAYHIYSRAGRKDKLTLAPFKDLKSLPLTKEIPKDESNEVYS